MTGSEIRINPDIRRIVCSLSGKEHDPQGYGRPIGLCSCCESPGKPLVIEYDLGAVKRRLDAAGAVSEESILNAFRDCGLAGVPVSYESAATIAALRDLRARDVIEPGSTVLLLMTASHFIPLGQE